jgi:hypothetical protein
MIPVADHGVHRGFAYAAALSCQSREERSAPLDLYYEAGIRSWRTLSPRLDLAVDRWANG